VALSTSSRQALNENCTSISAALYSQAIPDENHGVNSQHFALFISEMLLNSQIAILLAGNGDRNGHIYKIVSCLPTD
jgi:hypothetical protein